MSALAWAIFGATVVGVPTGFFLCGIMTAGKVEDAEREAFAFGRLCGAAEEAATRTLTTIARTPPAGSEWMDDIADALDMASQAERPWRGR